MLVVLGQHADAEHARVRIFGHDDDVFAMLNSTSGGARLNDESEPIAVPAGPGDATTTTPVGKWPITCRNSA